MGLLAKIKQALKPKENKKKKNVKTYTDNPLLKTKKKETSSTKKTTPKDIKGTLPTGKDRLDAVVKKKTTEKKTTTKTTINKTTDKKTLPKGPIKGTIPTGKDRIQETLKKKAEEKNPFKPEYSLGTAKNLFEGSPEKRAKNLEVNYQGKGSNTYNGNRSKIEEATKTKPNTKGDSPYQKYQANTVYNYYEEAKKAYDRGDIARGNLYVRKAQEHEEKYQTSKNAPKADPLTGNEALLLQTLSRSGSPEFTQKGLTSAQQEYANGDKTAEYGNIGGKLASNYKHDIDTAPFAQGVINGLGWVPVSRVVKNSSGVDDLNLEGDKTGFYTAGKMTGMLAQALGTGGVIKAASNLGRGVRGLINAGVDSVQNVVDAVDMADIQRERGLEIPDYINVSDVAEAKNGATVKRGTEPGKKAEDAKMIPVSIDRWNNDLIAQAWNRAEELGQDPIFGTDKNGRLHYSFTKEGLASILEYYNTFKNPTYSLESTGREYVDSDVLRIGRNMAINTGLSFAGGMIGKGGKQTLKNTEKVAPKTAEEVTESVAPKVDIEPKVKPKTKVKTKPKTEAPKVKTTTKSSVTQKSTVKGGNKSTTLRKTTDTEDSDIFTQIAKEEDSSKRSASRAEKASALADKSKAPTSTNSGDIKSIGKEYTDKANTYKQLHDELVDNLTDYIKNYKSKGAYINTNNVKGSEIGGKATQHFTTKISENEPWYRDFYKKNGRKPNKSEAKTIAEELVTDLERTGSARIDIDSTVKEELLKAKTDMDGYAEGLRMFHESTYPKYSDAEFQTLVRTGLEKEDWTDEMKSALQIDSKTASKTTGKAKLSGAKTKPKLPAKKTELPKAETKNTEYKIKQSEFTKNVNKAKEGDTVYKFKDGSEIKLESKVYNGKDGYDNFYTVVKNDGTKVENVLKEDLAKTLEADSTMQTLKPKADLPKTKEIKEVNNITDAINSKGFRNKLDNATEGTVLAKTKEGREIKYAGLDENGNDLFTVVRNGKTEAEEISLQELKKLKNLKLTSKTLPTKSVGADKARPAENMDDLIGKNIYRVDTNAGKKDLIAKDEEELVKLAENQGIELKGEPEVLHTINNLDDAKKYAVPDANEYGKISDTASTMMNAKILEGAENPAMAREAVQKSIEDGSYYKDVIPNYTRNELGNIKQGVVNKANKRINDVGIDEAMKDLESVVREGKRATSKDVALGYRVAEELGKAGRYDEMSEVLANVSSILSDAGRTLQAAKLFGVLTGDAKKIAITKQVNRIKKLHPDSDIKINKELLDNIVNATDDATAAKAQEEFFMDVWNQVPPSLVEKLDTFRHLAMLGNPKTHVRNMLGNAIFIIPRYVSDTLASGMEAMLIKSGVIAKRMAKFGNTDEIFRNKAGLFRRVDPEISKLAKDSFKGKADILLGNSSKYIEKSRPLDAPVYWKIKNGEKKSNPFGRLIDRLAKANGIALETEDKYFMGIAYDKAFKDFCSANKITKANMTEDLISKAEEYATQQCLEATYRNQNEIANALSKARKNFATIKDTDTPAIKAGKTVGRLVMDSAIPYIKTPANIVAKGVEYSPAGIFMGLYKLRAARTPKEFMRGIEYFAEGLTGSGLAGLGVYLAHRGIINGQLTEEDNKYYKQDLGQQSYAVTIKGKSVTVDWMVPAALPLLTGVAMYENVYNSVVASGEEGLSKLNTIATAFIEGLSTLPEPIMELSMLQGVENVIKQSFTDDNPLRAIGFNTATNYISQFVPTAAGQAARTIEPNRHTTEVVDKTGLAKGVEKTGKKLLNKIPFGTKLTQEYVDCWGRPVENGSDNALVRFIYQAFSPAYVSPDRTTKVDEEIIRLNRKVGGQIEGSVIPNWNAYTESKITIDETNYQMTDEDYTRYKKTVGQAKYEGLKELFNDKDYKAANDMKKADMVKEVYQAAKDKGVLEYVSTLGEDVKRKYLISKLPETTRERVKSGKVKNVDKLIKANDTLKEMDLGSINTKSGGTRQISALIKNGYTKEDLKDLGYSTKIKYTKTGKIKETSYSKAVHINELGFDYEAIYKETRKKKAVQAYDQNDSKSLDTAEEVKAWLDAEHPNWSNDKKWTYLYGATSVSRYSRSKYGY